MPEEILSQEAFSDYNKMLGVDTEAQASPAPAAPVQESTVQETEVKTEPTPVAGKVEGAQVDKPEEPQLAAPAQAAPAPASEDWFDLAKVNERFAAEFKSEEEIKEAIRSLNENRDYLGKRDYYKELDGVFEEMQNELSLDNMVRKFGSVENYERAIMQAHLSDSIPSSIASLVLSTDMTKIDNLQAIFLETIAKDPGLMSSGLTEDMIKKGILNRMGVDINDPEFDLSKYQETAKTNPRLLIDLSMGATQAKSFFKGLVDQAHKDIPEVKDFKKIIEQRAQERASLFQKRTNEWTTKAKELAGGFKEFKIAKKDAQGKEVTDFTFTVPKEFQDSVADYLRNYALQSSLDVTPETVVKMQAEIEDAFKDQYNDEIREAYMQEKLAKYKEELDIKVHNPKPISTQEAPEGHGSSYQDELDKQRAMYGLEPSVGLKT